LLKKLSEGKIVICDRYWQSNLYQVVKVKRNERDEMIDWIKNLGSKLPKPDKIILLDILPEISRKLMGKRKDAHEKSLTFQRKVRNLYLKVAKEENWAIIKCYKKVKGKFLLKSKEEINNEMYKKIKENI